MPEPYVVVLDAPLPPDDAERARRLSPGIELVPVADGGLAAAPLAGASVIYTTEAVFDPARAPRLRWVQLNTAAVNSILDRPITRTGVPIANVSGAYSTAVAECALAMLLAVTRRIPLACQFQAEVRWPDDYLPFQGEDLHGKTLTIVGYGSIGRQIARLAQAFGMTVLACKRHPAVRRDATYLIPGTGDPDGLLPAAWFGPDQLLDALRQADVAIITLPLTPETQGVIGKRELEALPPHAYLLSMGRGPVVDESALVDHLRAGKLAGAGLDVFAVEPLPSSSPLWHLPNVLILPHVASYTRLQSHQAAQVLLENLRRDLHGEPLVNVIDRTLKY
jgi:phosphoglycerate dehydrogenase-like enzyme